MDRIDALMSMGARSRGTQARAEGSTVTVVGRAAGASDSGRVDVVMPAESVTADGGASVSLATTVEVREGDSVIVTVANGSPVVTGVVGRGDDVAADVADAAEAAADALAKVRAAMADASKAAQDVRDLGQLAVTATRTEYATSASPDEAPAGGWSETPPDYSAGSWVWARTTVSRGDGTSEVTSPVLLTGPQGAAGTGVASSVVEYAAGDSGTDPPDAGWQAAPPARAPGQWLWRRTVTTWTDGASGTAYDVSRDGLDAPAVELATTNGAALRNSRGSTSVRATVLLGGKRATDAAGLAEMLGAQARLTWHSVGADGARTDIEASDPRLSEGGFLLRVDAADVDGQATYDCDLEY